MATQYRVDLTLGLGVIGQPSVNVYLDHGLIHGGVIKELTQIHIVRDLPEGPHTLMVEHCNKLPSDPSTELIVEAISFNGITSPKFVWQGVYRPEYPEPWATEQRNAGYTLAPELAVTNHLGWNGQWTLTFTAPIFTWIHYVEDLGWIHQ